mmetsp:Transcript_54249/g.173914  ORF Transcript_54249/g.173914 Transcript_54249/m.173914 type:complete len:215 (+) Transcript_54249:237-881(+)
MQHSSLVLGRSLHRQDSRRPVTFARHMSLWVSRCRPDSTGNGIQGQFEASKTAASKYSGPVNGLSASCLLRTWCQLRAFSQMAVVQVRSPRLSQTWKLWYRQQGATRGGAGVAYATPACELLLEQPDFQEYRSRHQLLQLQLMHPRPSFQTFRCPNGAQCAGPSWRHASSSPSCPVGCVLPLRHHRPAPSTSWQAILFLRFFLIQLSILCNVFP